MKRRNFNEDPNQNSSRALEGMVFGKLLVRNGVAEAVRGDVSIDVTSGDFRNGVDGLVMSSGVLNDGSERKEEDEVVECFDQVCSVSDSPVPAAEAKEASKETLVASSVVDKLKGKSDFDFNELVPFDFSDLNMQDALVPRLSSGESEGRNYSLKNTVNFDDIWSDHHPFTNNHIHNGNLDRYSTRPLEGMMGGLSLRDLASSSNVSAPSMSLNSSAEFFPDHVNGHIAPYVQPAASMMNNLSSNASLCFNNGLNGVDINYNSRDLMSSNNNFAPSALVDSSLGLVAEPAMRDRSISYVPPHVGPVMTNLTKGVPSSFSNGLNGVDGYYDAWRFNEQTKVILEMTMSRGGSRHLMNMLATGDQRTTFSILSAILSDVYTVMTAEHGLGVFKRLLKLCDHNQKEYILNTVASNPTGLIYCSRTYFGSKALIVLVDHLKSSELIHQIPSILAMEIYQQVPDRFASRVIEHCIIVLDPNQCEHLYEAMIKWACYLAMDTHLCSLLYTSIDNIKGVHRVRLLYAIADRSVQLAFDPIGNFVVKTILALKDIQIIRRVTYLLTGHYTNLAMDKHGSHVVETCIKSKGIHCVMKEFLKMIAREELWEIACDKYGNYVINEALKITEEHNFPYHRELVGRLLPGSVRLKGNRHGKNVYATLKDEAPHKKAY